MPVSEPLQSTTGVIAGTPTDVMEPVSRFMESAGMVRRRGVLTVYCRAGRERAILLALAREVIRELGAEKALRLRVRSWGLLWFLPMFKGGWHPPILEINGNIFSQGIVPEKQALKDYITKELSS